MGPPGGGKTALSGRFQSKFNVLNFTFPSDHTVNYIFYEMLKYHFTTFGQDDVK